LICLTPARVFKIIIQTAKRDVVIIDFMPNPKSTINTGTRAVREALRNYVYPREQ
jgi:predicted Ser/Thr protein kinase